jgi:hypothetical protein
MPVAEKSHAHSAPLQVLGASVDHRSGEVRLFVRTDAGNALLGFGTALAKQIGKELFAPPVAAAPVSKTGERHYRTAKRAAYLKILELAAADPSVSISSICEAQGESCKAFFAWRSYQRRVAKHPVSVERAPITKPSGALL